MRFARPTLAIAVTLLTGAAASSSQAQHQALVLAVTTELPTDQPEGPEKATSATATSATLARRADLRQFTSLLDYSGLKARLKRPAETYTVFAPTNDAVQKVPAHIREWLFRPGHPGLQRLMRSHIVAGAISYDQLLNGAELHTLSGEVLRVARQPDGTVLLNGVYRLRDAGLTTTNGIIYTIDSMIAPAN